MGRPDRLRIAELTSSIGAPVVGVGLGGLLGERLGGLADRRRIERHTGGRDLGWEAALYWTCWALLGLVAVGVIARLLQFI